MREHRRHAALSLDGGIHEVPVDAVPGRLWLCGKHVVGPDPERVLEAVGADVVVCLTERHELSGRYPTYTTWLDANAGQRALWFPVHDFHAPDSTEGAQLLADLETRLRAGQGLVVHCGAGIGRAGTVAVALMVLLDMPLDEALDHVRRHRPAAGPEVGVQLAFVQAVSAARCCPPAAGSTAAN